VSPYFSQAKAGDKETIAGIGLSLPLPITGRTHRAVDVATARQRQAETAALVAERELERDVLIAAQTFSTKLAETRRWSPDSAQKFQESAALADRHYRLGAVPIGTYVELQNSYLDAVEALFATQREALEAGLKLQQLTGLDFKPVEIAP
jgi:cobalt-zinc-cadmium efflux system outer membrane protein